MNEGNLKPIRSVNEARKKEILKKIQRPPHLL